MIRVKGKTGLKTDGASGYALCAKRASAIGAGQWRLVSTGVEISDMPPGLIGHVTGTRMMMAKGVLCASMVIDSLCSGEVTLMLMNTGREMVHIGQGEPVGQLYFSLALYPQMATDEVPHGFFADGLTGGQ